MRKKKKTELSSDRAKTHRCECCRVKVFISDTRKGERERERKKKNVFSFIPMERPAAVRCMVHAAGQVLNIFFVHKNIQQFTARAVQQQTQRAFRRFFLFGPTPSFFFLFFSFPYSFPVSYLSILSIYHSFPSFYFKYSTRLDAPQSRHLLLFFASFLFAQHVQYENFLVMCHHTADFTWRWPTPRHLKSFVLNFSSISDVFSHFLFFVIS